MHWVISMLDAELALRSDRYDCVLLDIGAADSQGEELLRRMRRSSHELPLIVVTGDRYVDHRIRLLDLGADDLLIKPVHPGELLARARAIVRCCSGRSREDAALEHGSLRAVPASRTVSRHGCFVSVTPKEYWVLEALMRGEGRVLSRRRLEDVLHGRNGDEREIASNPLEVHIHNLRRKFGSDLIQTVRGVGYRLGIEGQAAAAHRRATDQRVSARRRTVADS